MSLLNERLGLLHLSCIERLRINVEAGSWMQGVDNEEADKKRERGDHFKIEQSFDPDPAKLFQVAHRGDAVNNGAEDDRCNDHLDQIDESISQRFEVLTQTRVYVADHDAEQNRDQNLDIKNAVPRFPGSRVVHEGN